jgi:hypothetical protein
LKQQEEYTRNVAESRSENFRLLPLESANSLRKLASDDDGLKVLAEMERTIPNCLIKFGADAKTLSAVKKLLTSNVNQQPFAVDKDFLQRQSELFEKMKNCKVLRNSYDRLDGVLFNLTQSLVHGQNLQIHRGSSNPNSQVQLSQAAASNANPAFNFAPPNAQQQSRPTAFAPSTMTKVIDDFTHFHKQSFRTYVQSLPSGPQNEEARNSVIEKFNEGLETLKLWGTLVILKDEPQHPRCASLYRFLNMQILYPSCGNNFFGERRSMIAIFDIVNSRINILRNAAEVNEAPEDDEAFVFHPIQTCDPTRGPDPLW